MGSNLSKCNCFPVPDEALQDDQIRKLIRNEYWNSVIGKHFINKVDTVRDVLAGNLIQDINQARLEFDDSDTVRVVVRKDWDKSCGKVAVITGGGSGHEPAFASFVGDGFLTAAVCGNVFASPSTAAVYQAIKATATKQGVLVIVMNYTGDRLNFGLACEQAKAEGIKVRMLITADDTALPKHARDPEGKRNRGIAGTILVQKIACWAADQGKSLDEVFKIASKANGWVKTLGVSANACKLFDQKRADRMGASELELGLGIHGEPGLKKIALMPAKQLVQMMIAQILDKSDDRNYLPDFKPGTEVAVLLNNLGSVTHIEMSVLAKETIEGLQNEGARIQLFMSNLYMSSLDMKGFSISIMIVDKEMIQALSAPCTCPAWAPMRPVLFSTTSIPLAPPVQRSFDVIAGAGDPVVSVEKINAISKAFSDAKPELNKIDALVGDGDCGSSMDSMGQMIVSKLGEAPLASYKLTALFIGALLESAPGTSGAVYASLLTSFGNALPVDNKECTLKKVAECCMAALDVTSGYSGALEGDRTMFDALYPAARALQSDGSLKAAAQAAVEGAKKTASMEEARAGRSQYLGSENLKNNMDPGALAASIWLCAWAQEKNELI